MTQANQLPEADQMALWEKETQSGKKYLSGIVTIDGQDYRVVAFLNEEKQGKQPDYSFKKKRD